MRGKIIIVFGILFLVIGCGTTTRKFNKERKDVMKYEVSSRKVLDYQDTVRRYDVYLKREHFRIYTLVEPAILVKFPKIELSKYPIHTFVGVSGVVIVECDVDKNGKLIGYRVKKSGGLYLDGIVNQIIRKMVFKPGRILDKDYPSVIHITFIFREDEDI